MSSAPAPISTSPEPAEPHGESLHEVRASVPIPDEKGTFWQNWRAFVGPALLVSVGYMDPGNWATDLEAGANYKYALLWIVALSSLMAIVLQICAAKLGVVTGKDLARASRDYFPKWTRIPNWIVTEIAIAACDLAEVLGSAVAIHLLFPKISILMGVFITVGDVMLLMMLHGLGFRKIEAFILILVATIGGCYFTELFIFGKAAGEIGAIAGSIFQPSLPNPPEGSNARTGLAIAIGIIGATVMPHNLYLHSAVVQTRKLQRDEKTIRRAIRFNAIDSIAALSLAFFVNASILILAAITFHNVSGLTLPDGRPIGDDYIQGAYHTLAPLMGAGAASILFAVALLASGQSSTITGTLAGQVVMEGYMSWQIRPWVRRLVTRLIAIIPAVIVIAIYGDNKITDMLTISQIILGLQLPFAMIPLMLFTSRKKVMGKFVNGMFLKIAGWSSVVLITSLDIYLMWDIISGLITGKE